MSESGQALSFRSERTKEGRCIVAGLYRGDERIGCAWETTVADGLYNWSLHGVTDGCGWARDGYSMQTAMRDLTAASHAAKAEGKS